MASSIPYWVGILFLFAFIWALILFYNANNKPKTVMMAILLWAVANSMLAYIGFYTNTEAVPPRFVLVLVPTTIFIIYGLTGKRKNWIIKNRNLQLSVFVHICRIPVELTLYYLAVYKMVPNLMTFEGRNFDILAGLLAIPLGFLFLKKKIGLKPLLVFNFIGLVLVMFILVNGILSAELPIQQFAFNQPNKAVALFPYILLPAVVVPLVIYTHLSDILYIRYLLKHEK